MIHDIHGEEYMMYLFAYFVICTFHALLWQRQILFEQVFLQRKKWNKASVIPRKYGNFSCNSKMCITNTTSNKLSVSKIVLS